MCQLHRFDRYWSTNVILAICVHVVMIVVMLPSVHMINICAFFQISMAMTVAVPVGVVMKQH